jgi:hypothetical protein
MSTHSHNDIFGQPGEYIPPFNDEIFGQVGEHMPPFTDVE